jgi:hypothetical protein
LGLPNRAIHQPSLQVIDRVKIQQGIDKRAN